MSIPAIAATLVLGASGAAAVTGHGNGWGWGNDRGESRTAENIYTDGITDYGVERGTSSKLYNDWGNGWEEGETKRVLIYSYTPGPRHAHLGDRLEPGMNPPLNETNVAQSNLKAWLEAEGIEVDYTEDVSQLSRIRGYNAFISLSANRDAYDDTAQTSLKQFVRAGGGFVGIHNAFGAEYHWPWYEGLLGGANFFDHRPNREGTVETVNRKDVSTKNLPREWTFTDEWYNLVPFPSYVNVLAEVDSETSVTPERDSGHPGHPKGHPVSWCHYYDGGKAWLTTLGHDTAAWTDEEMEGDEYFQDHVVNGILSAMGIEKFCRS
ncbi:ThuA domain-containing protein [Mumia flava]|uniref:ThuA domain-containing protein n=1 Tax=Mumia flava TaxID=1348852 RepID=UPI000A5A0BA1|nr:ThuA domain-containing protein [Mumia flava]